MIQKLILMAFLASLVGCAYAPKKEVLAGSVPGAITVGKGIRRFLPGYWGHRLRMLDVYIQVKEKEVRLEGLRYEMKALRLKYDKLE